MNRKVSVIGLFLITVMLLTGCAMRTVDQMYTPPKRSAEHQDLQIAIDASMTNLEYCAPLSGENQQTVQMADLDGDGEAEYLLFARGSSENPLQILIFGKTEDGFSLRQTIESPGSAFEMVEYVDMDGSAGVELLVGRQVSDQVLRALTLYSFSQGDARQLMSANYSRVVTCDLNADQYSEIMVISSGATETDRAVATLYRFENETMVRSREMNLSETAENIKRIMVSGLHGGAPAVYVASAVEESAIITDVFALKNGRFENVSLSNESGTSVQTLRNYYVYADDIDSDGVLELPSLIPMMPVTQSRSASEQYLIRWYAMTLGGGEVDKMYTFHNIADGWYLQLDSVLAPRVTVVQETNSYAFYLWDEAFERNEKILTVYALSGSDRETAAAEDGRFLLYRADEVTYAAKLEDRAVSFGFTQENLTGSFHLIFQDWKTGETE